MNTIKLILGALLIGAPLLAYAETESDDTVAAGLIFKISYALGGKGTWEIEPGKEQAQFVEFEKFLSTLENDLEGFSKSDHGTLLKKESLELLELLQSVVISDGKGDPAEAATRLTDKVEKIARLSSTPTWVYRTENQSEQDNPITRP